MTREEMLASAKPIIFCGDMVRAILDGRKTMTRRVIKKKYSNTHFEMRTDKYGTRLVEIQNEVEGETFGTNPDGTTWHKIRGYIEPKPRFKKGDVLYVRETWQSFFSEEVTPNHQQGPRSCAGVPAESAKGHYMYYYYRADGEVLDDPKYGKACWMPSIFMPKVAARIFLRVTNVRAERVQDITEEDAIREGIDPKEPDHVVSAKYRFVQLWNEINAKRGYGWDENPWVWVISFERIA